MRSRHDDEALLELASPASPPRVASRARSSSSVARVLDCSVSETNEYSGIERRGEQLLLERLQPREVGAERHDTEVGLVPEHRDAQRLVAVGFERRDGVDDPLRRARARARPARDRRGSRGAGRPNRPTVSPVPRPARLGGGGFGSVACRRRRRGRRAAELQVGHLVGGRRLDVRRRRRSRTRSIDHRIVLPARTACPCAAAAAGRPRRSRRRPGARRRSTHASRRAVATHASACRCRARSTATPGTLGRALGRSR